jgi:hypothetical protein
MVVISWLNFTHVTARADASQRVFSDGGAHLSLMTFFLYDTSIPVLDLILLLYFLYVVLLPFYNRLSILFSVFSSLRVRSC